MHGPRRMRFVIGLTLVMMAAGCHREVKEVPLLARMIGISDRFFDVQALDADHAVVVGYAGKILTTADGGFTWTQVPTGTNRAIYRVRFVDANNGWASGQEGLMLHTSDGGKTWQRQKTGTSVYLFSIFFLDANRGWAVGDQSILLQTQDGGANWTLRKITTLAQKNLSAAEAVASADPVLYDIQFIDANTGWIVGEFGKIYHTGDGGRTWTEQEESLLGEDLIDILDIPTFFGVRFVDAQNGIVAGLDGKIARTSDGGTTWKFEKMNLDYPMVDPLFNPMLFPDGTGYAIGAAGEVVQLDAAGGAWHRTKLGMEVVTWLRGMSWLDKTNGWIVGGFGLILHTKDGGKTWIPSLA